MSKLHYSWVICFICAFMLLCTSGMPINVMPSFLPFFEEIGYTGTQGSFLVSLRGMMGIVGLFAVKPFYKKFSIKLGLTICCFLVAIGMYLMSFTYCYPVVVLGSILLGTSYGLGGIVPVTLLIDRWFNKHRGLAISIGTAGTGLSSMVFPPLITFIIQKYSLKSAFYFSSATAIVMMFLSIFLLKDSPENIGIKPLGDVKEEQKTRVIDDRRDLGKYLRIYFLFTLFILGCVTVPGYSHFTVYFSTEGYSKTLAATFVSIQGGILIASKCLYGAVSDKVGIKRTSIITTILLIMGFISCLFVSRNIVFLALYAILAGLGYPINTIGISLWAQEFSSPQKYSSLLRDSQLCYVLGSFAMGTMPGIIFDKTGRYYGAYLIFSVLLIIFFINILFIYRKAKH